jgi:hypothetical protein
MSSHRSHSGVNGLLFLVFLAIVAVGATRSSSGQVPLSSTVRGRIDRQGPSGKNSPAPYIRITLLQENTTKKLPTTYTGSDGLYYVRGVRSGTYILQVWLSPQKLYKSYRIVVTNKPYTDIKPIVISNGG